MWRSFAPMLVLLGLLVACGGAGGDDSTPTSNAALLERDSPPVVQGRLTHFIRGQTPSAVWVFKCEFDAVVDVSGQRVTEITRLGSLGTVDIGDEIVEEISTPEPQVWELGATYTRTYEGFALYRGDDGLLHQGCAAESQRQKVRDRGPGITPFPQGITPQVPGRLVGIIIADGESGGSTIYCEYDADVSVEGRGVRDVYLQGDRPEVRTGDTIANEVVHRPRPGTESPEYTVLGGVYGGGYWVYWAGDELRRGCAPESVRQ